MGPDSSLHPVLSFQLTSSKPTASMAFCTPVYIPAWTLPVQLNLCLCLSNVCSPSLPGCLRGTTNSTWSKPDLYSSSFSQTGLPRRFPISEHSTVICLGVWVRNRDFVLHNSLPISPLFHIQCITKLCQLYAPNTFWFCSLLSISTASTPVQISNISHLDDSNSLLTNLSLICLSSYRQSDLCKMQIYLFWPTA